MLLYSKCGHGRLKWSRTRALHAQMRGILALKNSNINLNKPFFLLLSFVPLGMTVVPTFALTSYNLGWERTICQMYYYSFLSSEANWFKLSAYWCAQLYHPH